MRTQELKRAIVPSRVVSSLEVADDLDTFLDPFTYFKDIHGFIFYAHHRLINNGTHGVRATLVYVPIEGGSRTCLLDGYDYEKIVFHGLSRELKMFENTLKRNILRRLKNLMVHHDLSGEEFLFMPSSDIEHFYSPRAALDKIISGGNVSMGLNEDAHDKVSAAVKLVHDKGVPSKDIGLYGGLQCFLVRNSQKQINDVDLLVKGTEHYSAICELSRGNKVKPGSFAANTLQSEQTTQAAARRGELSQFLLPQYRDTPCDVRILRKGGDANNYPLGSRINSHLSSKTITIEKARVVRADESLSLPYCFVVETSEGKNMIISGRYYEFIGAATIGDEIEAKGLQVDESNLLLIDANHHYVVTKKRGVSV